MKVMVDKMAKKLNQLFLSAFHYGYASDAYNFLGSFYENGKTTFRVYAPHAEFVSVVGDFNGWNVFKNPMTRVSYEGIWEAEVEGVNIYDNYKYAINKNNYTFFKQDPYGYHFETNGGTSSKIYPMDTFKWCDSKWMKERNNKDIYHSPINIYECHIGSWMKNGDYPMNYRDIGDRLIKYVKEMGYNYIEFLPIMEHPFLGSWGYQVTGYFGVTSRYGVPNDFMYLVNLAHKNGIGIILDWVPAHFPKDSFGLCEFDGEYLYEDPSPTRMEHHSWGTRIFNFAKPEIKSFLISSACFYFDKYHIDGIRVDAVAAMLYLDYDRSEWVPNIYGGNYNLEAIGFLQDLNRTCFSKFPNILMIAEESTAFSGVTKPIDQGGLGFNFKWNMGWMNDTLSYIETDPYFRGDHHNKLTFGMTYMYSENFILAISHDEVVHLKKSLIEKMPGYYDDKFSNLRTYLGFMQTIPGKKLLFMGQEIGQFREWSEERELDWSVLNFEKHQGLKNYVSKLNNLYLSKAPLHQNDQDWNGFNWLYCEDHNSEVFAYQRFDFSCNELLVILNFSGLSYDYFEITNNNLNGEYSVIFNSDAKEFGGEEKYIYPEVLTINDNKLRFYINKLSMIILEKRK